jgi:hypothetical protein
MTVVTGSPSSPGPTTLQSVTREGRTLTITQSRSKRISEPPQPRLADRKGATTYSSPKVKRVTGEARPPIAR